MHKILGVFLRYVTSFCGIKEECIKRGLGESLDVRICKIHLEHPAQYQPAVPPIINEQEEQEQEVIFTHPEVSEAPKVPEDDVQYDTDNGPDDAAWKADNDDDTLTFLGAITIRSGRAVQVQYFS